MQTDLKTTTSIGRERSTSKQMRRARKLTVGQRRWLLSAHIIFTIAWLGTAFGFIVLGITAVNASDDATLKAAYLMMETLHDTLLWSSALGVLVTGILLSVLTQWGLFRFYWIIVKEFFTVICMGLGMFGLKGWTASVVALTNAEGLGALHNPQYILDHRLLFLGIVFETIALSSMVIISVFKPWGQRGQSRKRVSVRGAPSTNLN
jgi:hypothetical protein